MGGNLLRVFAQVEKVSRQLQAEEKGRPKITESQPFHK
jgi:membrane dipeptidase